MRADNFNIYLFSIGYYRVNYDDKTWSAIANGLQNSHEKIHVLNRAQVFNARHNLTS